MCFFPREKEFDVETDLEPSLGREESLTRILSEELFQLINLETFDFVPENLAFPLSPRFLRAAHHDFNSLLT